METQPKPFQSDEIDLGQLFAKIGDFFRNAGIGVLRFIALIRRVPLENRTLFIVLIIFSAALSLTYGTLFKKKFYESTMILSSSYLNNRIVENTVDKLNLLAQEKEKSGLAKELRMSLDEAKGLTLFEAKPFIDQSELVELELLKEQLRNAGEKKQDEKIINQVISRIEIENRHSFEIKVRSLDPKVFLGLQNSLVNYFRTSDYIRKRIEITKANLQDRRKKLLAESQKLDSLKEVIYSNYKNMAEQARQGSNNVILSDRSVTNPIDVYNQDLSLYSQIQEIDRNLYIQPDFEVVSGFTEFSEPASASLPKMIAQATLIAIAFGYLLVALLKFNKYLASFDATN